MGNLLGIRDFVTSLLTTEPIFLDKKSRVGLLQCYDAFSFDCDGVLYHNDNAVTGSSSFVHKILKSGKNCYFVTNASGNSRRILFEKLNNLGFNTLSNPFTIDNMITASSAAAEYLVQNYPKCKRTYVVGKTGIFEELRLKGIEAFGAEDKGGLKTLLAQKFFDRGLEEIDSVVVGHIDEDICYERLAKGAVYARNRERPFIAANLDEGWFFEFEDKHVLYPAGGASLHYLKYAAEREPDAVVGKPSPELVKLMFRKFNLHGKKVLMIGDRLNTDIAFGKNGGMDTLLVLSGCHSMEDVIKAKQLDKPDYIAKCLGDIVECL